MKEFIKIIIIIIFIYNNNILAQSGTGHTQTTVLSYTPSGYSTAPKMLQDAGSTGLAKNTLNDNAAANAYVNFEIDTSGKQVYIVYTTDNSTPNKSNGNQVAGNFSNYNEPNRTWLTVIPAQSAATTVKYVFYITDSNLASAWGKIDANGYTVDWNDNSNNPYSYVVKSANTQTGPWGTTNTWASNSVPTSSSDVEIIASTTVTVSATSATTNDLSLISNGAVIISKDSNLTVTGDFTNSTGTLTLNSDATNFSSLIVQGTSTGDIIYNRWINSLTNGWDLLGSPVIGASLTSANFSENGGNYAIQPYDNTDNSWTAESGATVNTVLGKGYAMAKATASTEAFTGTIETNNKDVSITNNDGSGSGTQWNLVANPYPSYLALNQDASTNSSASADFLTQNGSTADVLGSGQNEKAVWYWNGSTYGTHNNSVAQKYIAPGQGFFIASKTGNPTLKFLETMQTTTGTDDFISNDIMEDNRGELFVSLNQNDLLRETEIYFIEEGSDGSDPTYDARTFPMNDNATSVFTRLVQGDQGVDLSIQALAYSEMWDKVIPLGINALGGEEMTISISHRTTPADLNIYLEDTQQGTMTNLLDGDYVLTPTSDLSGVGRFFIHMTADTMSNEEVSTSMLNAYKEIDASYITIEGLATQSNETKVNLYNILGREVLATTLNNNMGTQTISTVGLSAGIYVIELESGTDRLTKKLLIQ